MASKEDDSVLQKAIEAAGELKEGNESSNHVDVKYQR
jgi:hypothetical protein